MSERGQIRRLLLDTHSRLRDLSETVADVIDDIDALTNAEEERAARWEEHAKKAEARAQEAEALLRIAAARAEAYDERGMLIEFFHDHGYGDAE